MAGSGPERGALPEVAAALSEALPAVEAAGGVADDATLPPGASIPLVEAKEREEDPLREP